MEPSKPTATALLQQHLKRLESSKRLVPAAAASSSVDVQVTATLPPAVAAATAASPPVLDAGQREIKNGTILGKNERKMADLEYINSFPPGMRFRPTDEEVILHYLGVKLVNKNLPPTKIVDADVYKHHPQFLSEKYQPVGDNEWYFFTSRDRKYRHGHRPNREAGKGFWKATGADKLIKKTSNGDLIGFRRALVYYEGKAPKGDRKTNWIMHEFRVNGPPRQKEHEKDMKLDDWVLCKIYNKGGEINGQDQHGLKEEKEQNSSTVSNGLKASTSDTAGKANDGATSLDGQFIPVEAPAQLPDFPPRLDVPDIGYNSMMYGGGRCHDNLLQPLVSSYAHNYGAHPVPMVEPLRSMVPVSGNYFPADPYVGFRYHTANNSWDLNQREVQFQGGSGAEMRYFTNPFAVAGIRNCKYNSGQLDHSDGHTSRLVRMDQIITAAHRNQPTNNPDNSSSGIPPSVTNVGKIIDSLNQLANSAGATNLMASYSSSAPPVANNFLTIHAAGTTLGDQLSEKVQESAI